MIKKLLTILKSGNAFGTIFWFSIIGFLRPAINVFLIPLYLSRITPEKYGLLSLVLIVSAVVGSFACLRLKAAFQTLYFYHNEEEEKLWNYFSQIFSLSFVLAVFWFVIFMLIGPALFEIMFPNSPVLFFPYGVLAISQVLISECVAIYYAYLKNGIKVKEFVLLSLSATLASVIFQAYFILQLNWGIKGILLGTFLSALGQLIYITLKFPKLFTLRFQWKSIKESIQYSLPLIPFTLLFVFEKQLDKLMIERYLDLEQVGLYTLLMAIIGLSVILLNAMDNAFRPYLFEALKKEDARSKQEVQEYFIIYQIVGLLTLMGILILGNHLHLITDNLKYQSIIPYFPIGVIAVAPFLMVRFIAMLFLFYKKTSTLTYLTFIKFAIMFLLMFFLIPKFGIIGALTAIGISHVINLILFSFLLKQLAKELINYFPAIFRLLLFVLAVGMFFLMSQNYSGILSSWIGFLLLIVCFYFLDKKKVLNLIGKNGI